MTGRSKGKPKSASRTAQPGVIVIDVEKCLACKTCELECAVAHSHAKDLADSMNESPRPSARVSVVGAEDFAFPLQCRHCEDAPCIKICPTKAIARLGDDQPVLIDQDKCIGCKWCVMVCPFGVIEMDDDRRVLIKCDLCTERLGEGELPACVAGCPTHAIQYKPLAEVVASRKKKAIVGFLHEMKQGEKK
jgi:anaerobic carbon-monoxide dehydrogenase iron sulfur subunit